MKTNFKTSTEEDDQGANAKEKLEKKEFQRRKDQNKRWTES